MKLFLIIICLSFLSGCTTMQNFSDVGSSFDQGKYLDSVFLLTSGTPISLAYDVLTFGGTMEAEQGMQAWQEIERSKSAGQ